MQLHLDQEIFDEIVQLTASYIKLPLNVIIKDYFITLLLFNLSKNELCEKVVFKGGTSLSKCYPNSIERFSEDIDLTFIPDATMSNKDINKTLKLIEKIMVDNAHFEPILKERNSRNKSAYVWFRSNDLFGDRIKLEIGSSVRPHPYSKRRFSSYVCDYLNSIDRTDIIKQFNLNDVLLNVLHIERTFIDKVMAVKRHFVCNTLEDKVRHIYDVVQIFEREEIQKLLNDKESLKKIVRITKETDSSYLSKRGLSNKYNPNEPYNFETFKKNINQEVISNYERLHESLLYTNQKQDWKQAEQVFSKINNFFKAIDE